MNNIVMSGNVGKDPEMKYFDSGSIVANFPLAVSFYDHKEKENKTVWLKCKVWGKKAEFTGEYIKKGSKVIVSGSLFVEEFEDKNGQKRSSYGINITDIESLDKKSDSSKEAKKEEQNPDENLVEFGEDEIPF